MNLKGPEVRVLISWVLVALLAAATVTVFTLAAVDSSDLFYGDSAIFSALRLEDKTWQSFFARFDLKTPATVGMVLMVSAALLVLRKRWEGIAALFILPALGLTVALPKFLIGRARPPGGLEGSSDSFPSGTAATSILVLGLLIYFVGAFVAPRRLRIGLQLLLGLPIMILGVFRLLASEHWPSDLLGGYLAGALALIAIVWLYRWMRERRGFSLPRGALPM